MGCAVASASRIFSGRASAPQRRAARRLPAPLVRCLPVQVASRRLLPAAPMPREPERERSCPDAPPPLRPAVGRHLLRNSWRRWALPTNEKPWPGRHRRRGSLRPPPGRLIFRSAVTYARTTECSVRQRPPGAVPVSRPSGPTGSIAFDEKSLPLRGLPSLTVGRIAIPPTPTRHTVSIGAGRARVCPRSGFDLPQPKPGRPGSGMTRLQWACAACGVRRRTIAPGELSRTPA